MTDDNIPKFISGKVAEYTYFHLFVRYNIKETRLWMRTLKQT